MAYSPQHGRKLADRQIRRLGGRRASLLRDGTPHPIMVRILDYSSGDRRGDLVDPLARRCLISTFAPDGSDMLLRPDKETDRIITYLPSESDDSTDVEETLRIISRPTYYEAQGVVMLWDLQVLE